MRHRDGLLLLTASAVAMASAARAAETITHSYDALGRLTATSSDNTRTTSVGYDPAGNRSVYAMSVSGIPSFSISDAAAVEGGGLVFTVVKNGSGAGVISYALVNGSAGAPADYYAAGGTLTFAAGESSKTIAVTTYDDTADEPSETIFANLTNPSANATVTDWQGVGTIFDNDETPPPPPPPPPVFSIGNASATEGGILQFTVTKTGATVGSFGFTYEATHNTAGATWDPNNPGDFYRTTANLFFSPTETSKTISIPSAEDGLDEGNETFFVNLSNPTGGATFTNAQGIGTIVDNDEPPPPPPPGNLPPTPTNNLGYQKGCATKLYDVVADDTDPDNDLPLTLTASSNPRFQIVGNQISVDGTQIGSGASTLYTVRDKRDAYATATLTVELTKGRCTGD